MADFNLLIENGRVIDGTGSPGFDGAVGINGNRLSVLRGDTSDHRAEQRIDARGRVIAPGFIDLHSHSGIMIMAEPRHEPKVRQGVTTEVIGVDGNSYAPFRSRADLYAFARLNGGLDGIPDLEWDWGSVDSYLQRLDRSISLNLALMVGNSALRIDALGWDDVPADKPAIARMRGLLRESMEAGAFGISTGLDYPPGSFASTDELAELTNEAARLGGFYHTHVRYPLGDRFLDPFREALQIGQRGEGPVHITHFYHRPIYPGSAEQMIGLVEDARAGGQDVTWDSYPYEWSCTRLLIQLPQWVQAGGPDATLERIANPEVRGRIRDEMYELGRAYANENPYDNIRLGYFSTPEYAKWEGRTIGDFTRATGEDAVDAICDMLIAEDLRPNQVTSGPTTESLGSFMVHPLSMFGTDSTFVGEKPSPRTYGSFPRVLGEFVRELRLMTLETAVRKMTGSPSARLGLADRGLLRDGMKADVTIFDPETVHTTATYDDPRSFPIGIDWVIVNGQIVVAEGVHTGATPGRALRRGRID
ncbi:MAG: amidohydrolase family protein [Chloroflexota bacterium]